MQIDYTSELAKYIMDLTWEQIITLVLKGSVLLSLVLVGSLFWFGGKRYMDRPRNKKNKKRK
jgi:hypothetical protein